MDQGPPDDFSSFFVEDWPVARCHWKLWKPEEQQMQSSETALLIKLLTDAAVKYLALIAGGRDGIKPGKSPGPSIMLDAQIGLWTHCIRQASQKNQYNGLKRFFYTLQSRWTWTRPGEFLYDCGRSVGLTKDMAKEIECEILPILDGSKQPPEIPDQDDLELQKISEETEKLLRDIRSSVQEPTSTMVDVGLGRLLEQTRNIES